MKKFAQVTNGVVDGVLWAPAAPTAPPAGRVFVDITDRPGTQSGDSYDAVTNMFAPAPPQPRVLSYNELIQLFTGAERKSLRALAQTNEDAADVLDLLRTAPAIPLAAPRTAQLLQQLVTLGVLTAQRRAAILAS